jgi:hypothetical protein
MEIHLRSYLIPIQKDGTSSLNDIVLGLKAMQVTSLNNVKIRRKMSSRFTTHSNVFGILYLTSINGYKKR